MITELLFLFLGVIILVKIADSVILPKEAELPPPCEGPHTWTYDHKGDMICSTCLRKPFSEE